jgi:hypothetical protein
MVEHDAVVVHDEFRREARVEPFKAITPVRFYACVRLRRPTAVRVRSPEFAQAASCGLQREPPEIMDNYS